MAKRAEDELSTLRKTVATYVRSLIGVGIAAQTLSSAGGSYLAISRLISSGIALASQLQRGIIVRVVGAPLVRRRPRRRSRGEGADEYPEPPASVTQEAEGRYQGATEWEEAVSPPLALAEMNNEPFALARMLPSIVAAQQSTFRALSSVSGAVARAGAGTSFAPGASRVSPSQTSLEPAQRGSPDAFPENQATSFAEQTPALAVGTAFRAAASNMALNLSSAAHEMTNIALGSQAVGAGFAPPQSRAASEGTGFSPSSQAVSSPSLLQQSITGSVDTSLKSPSPSGANLGLAAGAGSLSNIPVTRESPLPPDLSAEVGGPSGVQSGAASVASSGAGANVELNAGPYAVPNGFNSVLTSPAFATASALSMQVRSLGSSGSSTELPLRASQAPSMAEGGAPGMAVVPEQYPSSYPTGTAFAMSSIVASLGLVESRPVVAQAAAQGATGPQLTSEEAPGMEGAAGTVAGAFVGEPLEARGSGTVGASVSPAETGQSRAALSAEEGGAPPSGRGGFDSLLKQGPRAELAPYQQLFGERWLASIATAAGLGSAVIGLLTFSSASPRSGLASAVAPPGGLRAGLSTGAVLQGNASQPRAFEGGRPSRVAHEVPEMPLSPALRPPKFQGGGGTPSGSSIEQDFPLSAKPSETAEATASSGRAYRSVWEIASLLPGILTPSTVAPAAGRGSPRSEAGLGESPPQPAPGAPSFHALGALTWLSEGLGALRVASSMRDAFLAVSANILGASRPDYPAYRAPVASRPELAQRSVAPPERGGVASLMAEAPSPRARFDREELSPSPGPIFEGKAQVESGSGAPARATARDLARRTGFAEEALRGETTPKNSPSAGGGLPSSPRSGPSGVGSRVDRVVPSGAEVREGGQQPPTAPGFTTSYLPALQAALAQRAMLAARVTGSAARAFSLGAALPPRPETDWGRGLGTAATPPGTAFSPFSETAQPDISAVLPAARPESRRPDLSSRESGVSGTRGVGPAAPSQPSPASPPSLPVTPAGTETELEAAPASRSREGRATIDGSFFGLEAVAQTLSLAARLPSAARLTGSVAPPIPRASAQPRGAAAARQTTAQAPSEAMHAAGQSPQLVEGWRSGPEEALTRMLGEPSKQPPAAGTEPPQEQDDRELRRKIEKMIDEDLRRHGY